MGVKFHVLFISRGSIFAGLTSTNKVRIGSSLVSRSSEIELVGWFVLQHKPTRKQLGRVNFCKAFWDCFQGLGKNWPIADRRVLSGDPRNNCGIHFRSSSFLASKVANWYARAPHFLSMDWFSYCILLLGFLTTCLICACPITQPSLLHRSWYVRQCCTPAIQTC